jgi:hypothetical protein
MLHIRKLLLKSVFNSRTRILMGTTRTNMSDLSQVFGSVDTLGVWIYILNDRFCGRCLNRKF